MHQPRCYLGTFPVVCSSPSEHGSYYNHDNKQHTVLETPPPAALNYSDDEYPFLDGTKKQCTTDTATNNSSTQDDTASETLTAVNLDELQSAYEAKCDELGPKLRNNAL